MQRQHLLVQEQQQQQRQREAWTSQRMHAWGAAAQQGMTMPARGPVDDVAISSRLAHGYVAVLSPGLTLEVGVSV